MYDQIKSYCQKFVSLNDDELKLVDNYFESRSLAKKTFLLEEGKVCHFIAFIASGSIRHFHVKDGLEKTCDITFENAWVTDFQSFTHGTPSRVSLQAITSTEVYLIQKENLSRLYQACQKYETFGRLMAEQVAQRATDIAMSLSSDKPEERFTNLLQDHPQLFQRIPQKYIANFLGISAESLSRIRSRVKAKGKS